MRSAAISRPRIVDDDDHAGGWSVPSLRAMSHRAAHVTRTAVGAITIVLHRECVLGIGRRLRLVGHGGDGVGARVGRRHCGGRRADVRRQGRRCAQHDRRRLRRDRPADRRRQRVVRRHRPRHPTGPVDPAAGRCPLRPVRPPSPPRRRRHSSAGNHHRWCAGAEHHRCGRGHHRRPRRRATCRSPCRRPPPAQTRRSTHRGCNPTGRSAASPTVSTGAATTERWATGWSSSSPRSSSVTPAARSSARRTRRAPVTSAACPSRPARSR